MNHQGRNHISAYVKGDENTPDYYRIHQYLNRMDNARINYHLMLPSHIYHRYVPIREHHIVLVAFLYLLIYGRTVWALLKDAIWPPNFMVINRRIMPKKAVFPVWPLIKMIRKRGKTCIIWDFDDDVVSLGECSKSDFCKMSEYAHHIVVTHQHLASLVASEYQEKMHILPTTDGDLYKIFNQQDVNQNRKKTLEHQINLVWVATSANLAFLETIIPQLDKTAQVVKETLGKTLQLKVVCNYPLNHQCHHLTVENVKWTRQAAVKEMQEAHIGIMPLIDNNVARGKGGFKLVQYLSIGLPCIGTDVGFNNTVINPSYGRLIPPDNISEWTHAILLLSDENTWENYSINAYQTWKEKFSFDYNFSFWKKILTPTQK